MSTSVTTVQELSKAIAAARNILDEQSRRIATAIIDLLPQGDPITPAQIAGHARVSEEVVLATLKGWPGGVFWDDEGRVVGSWGLAISEMPHKFQTDGGKPIYAWCALDPFLIVPVIGRPLADALTFRRQGQEFTCLSRDRLSSSMTYATP